MVRDIMKNLLKERPAGSKNNRDILLYLENLMVKMDYDIKKLPFTCTTCETGESCFILNDRSIEIQSSPFSQPFEGSGRLAFVKSLEELETANCRDCILVVGGELVVTPLQPKELVSSNYDIDIVPFNGEEYYEASGEVEYLKYISSGQDKVSLVINIDSPCHVGSKIAVSLYNFADPARETVDRLMQTQKEVVYGPEWYAGDHAAFAFRGIPCMVLSSSDLFEGGLDNTHTMRDTLDTVDLSQVELAADYIDQTIAFYK